MSFIQPTVVGLIQPSLLDQLNDLLLDLLLDLPDELPEESRVKRRLRPMPFSVPRSIALTVGSLLEYHSAVLLFLSCTVVDAPASTRRWTMGSRWRYVAMCRAVLP